MEGKPALSVGIDLSVFASYVCLIPYGTMFGFKGHQSCRCDAVDGGIEKDQPSVVVYAGNLPRSHLSRLVALVDNGVGNNDGIVSLVR